MKKHTAIDGIWFEPDIKGAEPVYCVWCNLDIAPGARFTVRVRGETYHDNCYQSALRNHKFLTLYRSSAGICSED